MNGFDPMQDTFYVLAGGKVKKSRRPGEQFASLRNRLRALGCNGLVISLAIVALIGLTL